MSSSAVSAIALGVSKENVGKMVKTSKARVTWNFCFANDLVPHKIELAHSLVSGKVDISLDSVPAFQTKTFSGKFEHIAVIASHLLKISIKDTFDGFLYDLQVDNVPYSKLVKKTLGELAQLKKDSGGEPVVSLGFAAFTGTSSALLDGSKAFNAAAAAPPAPPARDGDSSFNPFDGLEDTFVSALPSQEKRQLLVVSQDHIIDDANADDYAGFNILSLAKGAQVELVAGDLQAGLPEPYEDYCEVRALATGQVGKVAKVALAAANN